jgi:hypothetical protein
LQQWDVARNSTATYFDANGVLQTAGINEPRIDYDPATGECRGLLVEGQSTNLLTWSEDFGNAVWSKVGAIVTPSAAIAPDGSMSAARLQITGGSFNYIQQVLSSLTETVTSSIWVKSAGAGLDSFRLYADAVAPPSWSLATAEWSRLDFSKEVTSPMFRIAVPPIGDAVDIYIWGAQLEQADKSSSYIKTEASAVTRVADIITPTV